jgi:hypothetical protein
MELAQAEDPVPAVPEHDVGRVGDVPGVLDRHAARTGDGEYS